MTWCPTSLAILLDTYARTVGVLFPLGDVLTSCDVKQEERAYFMFPLCLVILHYLADLQRVILISDYLRKLDTDDAVIMDVFGLSKKFVYVTKECKTPLFDQFLNGFQEDEFANFQHRSELEHLITLHNSAHPVQRSGNDDKSTSIHSDLNAVKEKVINNLQENVANQRHKT